MSNAHRLDNEQLVGEDDRVFPDGINHVEAHRVPPGPQVIKHVPGPFIPGIGQGSPVFHGVAPSEGSFHNDVYESAEYQATLAPRYEPLPTPVAPVPVVIVSPDSGVESFNDWRTISSVIQVGFEEEVLGKDMHRSRMLIRNEGTVATDTVRIASRRGEAASSGFLILPGGEEEINSQAALYAVALVNPVKLSVLCEYSVNG